ncbi:MAG: alpha/beta fold hydrolase [Planctomycetota bacterium]
MKNLLEFVGFQLVWIACVAGAAHGSEWLGCAAALVFTVAVARRSEHSASACGAAFVTGVVCSSADAVQRGLGWIEYEGSPLAQAWAPAWIVALWVAFAATLSSSLAWLRGRWWISLPFAAIGAPLSYLGAERLGAVSISAPRASALAGVAVAWCVALHAAQWLELRLRAPAPRALPVGRWATLLALALPVTWGCTSMNKQEIERRLLALEKNAPVRAAGLQTLDAEVTLAGERVRARYHFHRAGQRGRPVVVLVHGTPSSLFTWTELVHGGPRFAGLAEDFDVVALDALGHATTRTQLERYSFQACADWVSGFLDALDLRDVTIVGQSYGGEFAWRAALDRPERVARVVLMNASGVARLDDEWLPEEIKMREWKVAKWGWLFNSRARITEAVQPHFRAPVPAERLEEYFLVCENADNWHCMIDLARDENGTRADELATLRQPVLLLWGERDIAYRPERFAAEFARRLPNGRVVLVPDAGHYPHEECPTDVVREIRAFVAATL